MISVQQSCKDTKNSVIGDAFNPDFVEQGGICRNCAKRFVPESIFARKQDFTFLTGFYTYKTVPQSFDESAFIQVHGQNIVLLVGKFLFSIRGCLLMVRAEKIVL